MSFTLPPLPFPADALEPVISARAMILHHEVHHQAYVTKLNGLIADRPAQTLEDWIIQSAGKETAIFNQAGQVWNHAFFWQSLAPKGASPSGALAEAIASAFGDATAFVEAAVARASGHFGSGWLWLVSDADGAVSLRDTHDGEPGFVGGATPLLVVDLWEHAYYLDHQSRRPDFVRALVKEHWNWRFAEAQFAAATAGGPSWRFADA